MESASGEFVVRLPSDVHAAGLAREFVGRHSAALPPELADDAALLVSELVTNAVQHGRPDITLRVNTDPPLIGVSVEDTSDLMPPAEPHPAHLEQTHGRGLVDRRRLASEWGMTPNDSGPGKTVWFRIDPTG